MIVVVADTSPLNYLIQIHCEHVLPALYEHVFVPTAVVEELNHPGGVPVVRTWLTHAPSWLMVREVASAPDPGLAQLDLGKRQAIQLAKQERADLLLMDEELGVRIARERGLAVTGTLGVLPAGRQARLGRCGARVDGSAGHGLPLQSSSDQRSSTSGEVVDLNDARRGPAGLFDDRRSDEGDIRRLSRFPRFQVSVDNEGRRSRRPAATSGREQAEFQLRAGDRTVAPTSRTPAALEQNRAIEDLGQSDSRQTYNVDVRCRCGHPPHMSKMIQIRNVL